jgi:hypothetical protein
MRLQCGQNRASGFRSEGYGRVTRWALLVAGCSGKVFSESAMATNRQQVVCSQCDKPEEYCTCEKYCTICKGQLNIRLGVDGLYYCPDCREACDVALANDR